MCSPSPPTPFRFFFFNDTATTEIYTLSLHDALPICSSHSPSRCTQRATRSGTSSSHSTVAGPSPRWSRRRATRSEEHTSEFQSRQYLVCRLLLEKKKKKKCKQLQRWMNHVVHCSQYT